MTDRAAKFASPATLLTWLIDSGIDPSRLDWRVGAASEPGRWFVAAESDPTRLVVVDPRRAPVGPSPFAAIAEAAEAEWSAGAPRPWARLRSDWLDAGGSPDESARPDNEAVAVLLPLLPGLRRRPPAAADLGRLFGLLMRHRADAVGLPLTAPIEPDPAVLGESAGLADAHLRLRVLDARPEAVRRLEDAAWIGAGPGPVRAPGPVARAFLDLLPIRWHRVDVELVPPDPRPVLGGFRLGGATLAARPEEAIP